MKVFISWSGELSHKVATIFRDWLPSVIQTIEPYVSSEDIDKGARWSTDIAKELEDSSFGILCITRDNVTAPWLNFEAGALSKSIDKSKVIPFLFGVKRSEIKGPTLQFQSTIHEKNDIKKLLCSLNKSCDPPFLDENRLDKTYDVWWPKLDERLSAIQEKLPEIRESKQGKAKIDLVNSSILEEILELVRNQQKLLNSPEAILPPEYFRHILKEKPERSLNTSHPAFEDLIRRYYSLLEKLREGMHYFIKEIPVNKHDRAEVYLKILIRDVMALSRPIDYLMSRNKTDLPFHLVEEMNCLIKELQKMCLDF